VAVVHTVIVTVPVQVQVMQHADAPPGWAEEFASLYLHTLLASCDMPAADAVIAINHGRFIGYDLKHQVMDGAQRTLAPYDPEVHR
jgi:hypothetical protein